MYSFYHDLQQLALELHTIRVAPQRGDRLGQVDAIDPLSFNWAGKMPNGIQFGQPIAGILIQHWTNGNIYQNYKKIKHKINSNSQKS